MILHSARVPRPTVVTSLCEYCRLTEAGSPFSADFASCGIFAHESVSHAFASLSEVEAYLAAAGYTRAEIDEPSRVTIQPSEGPGTPVIGQGGATSSTAPAN